jgi:hypothetical protein
MSHDLPGDLLPRNNFAKCRSVRLPWFVSGWQNVDWPRGVAVSTLDSESSDRGSNPREAFEYFGRPIIRARAPDQKYSVLEHVMQHWNDIPAACLRRAQKWSVAEQAVFFLRCVLGTVAILAQGTSWAVAVTQAFLPWFKSHDMLKCPLRMNDANSAKWSMHVFWLRRETKMWT